MGVAAVQAGSPFVFVSLGAKGPSSEKTNIFHKKIKRHTKNTTNRRHTRKKAQKHTINKIFYDQGSKRSPTLETLEVVLSGGFFCSSGPGE